MTEVIESMDNLKMKLKSVKVLYCGNCSLPFEYCEFGPKPGKCKSWLKENNAELFSVIYGEQVETEGAVQTEETAKPAAQDKKKKVPAKKKVIITTVERTKRKRVTHVSGLELFGVDLKKASKMFAGKFAASSSVSKTGAGADEIVIQGDCSFDLMDYILQNFPAVTEKDVEIVEGKKK